MRKLKTKGSRDRERDTRVTERMECILVMTVPRRVSKKQLVSSSQNEGRANAREGKVQGQSWPVSVRVCVHDTTHRDKPVGEADPVPSATP